MADHLWLIGMMGSGKSAVGSRVAAHFGVRFIDTDAEVSRRTGCSIAQLWGTRGEAAFRAMESAAVAQAAGGDAAVIATGGGVVLDPANVAAMRGSGTVVWLTAPPETLAARAGSGASRPLLADDPSPSRLALLLEERSSLYAAAADHVVETGSVSLDDVAERIEELWIAST